MSEVIAPAPAPPVIVTSIAFGFVTLILTSFFFFQAEDGIRDLDVTGVQTCALPISALGWRLVNPKMAAMYGTLQMGETAERVAQKYEVSREDQDAFALRSHQRAVAAQRSGRLAEEIVPVEVPQ